MKDPFKEFRDSRIPIDPPSQDDTGEAEAEYDSIPETVEKALDQLGGIKWLKSQGVKRPAHFMALVKGLLPMKVKSDTTIRFVIQHAIPPPPGHNVMDQEGNVLPDGTMELAPDLQPLREALQRLTPGQRQALLQEPTLPKSK